MSLKRYQDWPARLEQFLEQAKEKEFAWGKCDCGIFAASWIYEATGTDYAAPFRGAYEDAEGAARVMAEHGHDGLASLATAMLGAPLPSPRYAQRGDIVLGNKKTGSCLGIMDLTGRYFAACTENRGLGVFRRADAIMAWRL